MKYLYARAKYVYETRGARGIALALWRRVVFVGYFAPYNLVAYTYVKKVRKPRYPTFVFNGKEYDYFYHTYNFTWDNERIIEIPIVWEMVREAQAEGKRVLEIGNVLSHYYPITHDVLDKYERGDNIINEDIHEFKPKEKYDLIVSISTMEHVGWDPPEEPDPSKLPSSLLNIKSMLTHGGKMVITMPLGYNHNMDKELFANKLPFDTEYFLQRIDKHNQWEHVSKTAAHGLQYGKPFHAANGLVVGVAHQK